MRGSIADVVTRAVRDACDPETETTPADAVLAVSADRLWALFHDQASGGTDTTLLTRATAASPGAATGRLVLRSADLIEAGPDAGDMILVKDITTADDVLAMRSAAAVVTAHGGVSSHAAVVARGWGIPAVVGAASLTCLRDGVVCDGRFVAAGTQISVDGATGEIFLGALAIEPASPPAELDQLLSWADELRGGITVRANADSVSDAAEARRLGAQGIGLCRTEHMFFADDRLPVMQRFILSSDPTEQSELLARLEAAQEADFAAILDEMAGDPVTIRLLDPPLHEFLPTAELRESNPMMGMRGVRLGLLWPDIYPAQVRALGRAVVSGHRGTSVEIMIPFTAGTRELTMARRCVEDALASVGLGESEQIRIGAMIETPRMALVASQATTAADFFSFGTNDLTQLTFGFSRDDVESVLLPAYLDAGLLTANPFEVIDRPGVGRLIQTACAEIRSVEPDFVLGMCGEQAGDPASAAFIVETGLNYVSCSPRRVPIARLAIAQAVLNSKDIGPAAAEAAVSGILAGPSLISAETAELEVLHALIVKGFADADALAPLVSPSVTGIHDVLVALARRGFARHFERRGLWQGTEKGRAFHRANVAHIPHLNLQNLGAHYEDFLPVNIEFKNLCTWWQSAPELGSTGSHFDAAVRQLTSIDNRLRAILASFTADLARFKAYQSRLSDAAAAFADGDTRRLTGVACESYHDIWMELHEDLVQILGIDRHAEGSY
ncbi:hypothetical protein A5742_04875 [Mycolicibacterium fortuitum]|uniref:Pyruvate, phosphate dikinase n=1 Tax=Mycolicibacterium fortuitum TaxID=1766 RepID=A0ABD6QI22_MYCFO|nr:hypothetical protein A5742_04875 [Mycolicibacterium fortuitum]